MTICIPEAGNSYSCLDYQKLKPLAALAVETIETQLTSQGPFQHWDSTITLSQLRPGLLQENRKSCDM